MNLNRPSKVYTHLLTLKELLKTAEKKWDEIDILDAQKMSTHVEEFRKKGWGAIE